MPVENNFMSKIPHNYSTKSQRQYRDGVTPEARMLSRFSEALDDCLGEQTWHWIMVTRSVVIT